MLTVLEKNSEWTAANLNSSDSTTEALWEKFNAIQDPYLFTDVKQINEGCLKLAKVMRNYSWLFPL